MSSPVVTPSGTPLTSMADVTGITHSLHRYRLTLHVPTNESSNTVGPLSITTIAREVEGGSNERLLVGEWFGDLPDTTPDSPRLLVAKFVCDDSVAQDWQERLSAAADRGIGDLLGTNVLIEKHHPRAGFHAVREGRLRSVWLTSGKRFAILVEDTFDADVKKEPKNLRTSLVMTATLAVWGAKLIDFALSPEKGTSFSFMRLFHTPTGSIADAIVHLIFFFFIIVHHWRMSLGVEFAAYDATFARAKETISQQHRHAKKWIEMFLLAIIVTASVFLTYTVSLPWALPTLLILTIQAACMRSYLRVFDREMNELDEDATKNRFIWFMDWVFIFGVFFTWMVWVVRLGWPDAPLPWLPLIPAIPCVGYALLTFFEYYNSYQQSWRDSWRALLFAGRQWLQWSGESSPAV